MVFFNVFENFPIVALLIKLIPLCHYFTLNLLAIQTLKSAFRNFFWSKMNKINY